MLRLKTMLISLAAVVPAAVLGVASSAQAATPAVSFTYVYVNSPGSDDRSNKSLNAEYFRLKNNSGKTIQLKNWTVRDKSGHVYTFGSYSLKSKHSVTVHTGKGTAGKPAGHRYWGSGNYIWNNTGDKATLKNTAKKTIDTCSWKTVTKTTC